MYRFVAEQLIYWSLVDEQELFQAAELLLEDFEERKFSVFRICISHCGSRVPETSISIPTQESGCQVSECEDILTEFREWAGTCIQYNGDYQTCSPSTTLVRSPGNSHFPQP